MLFKQEYKISMYNILPWAISLITEWGWFKWNQQGKQTSRLFCLASVDNCLLHHLKASNLLWPFGGNTGGEVYRVDSRSAKRIYTFAGETAQLRPGVQSNTWRWNTERKRKDEKRVWIGFVDFPKMEAEREQKHVRTHCHFDTSVSPRSKGDGGAMCDTNEQEPHWYSPC